MEDFEDTDFVASEHDRLISAISKLDKTQHITEPTRNEPTSSKSEFNLIKRSNKLNLNEVAKVLGDTATHVKITKKLKKNLDVNKVLRKPLEKPQADRIKRATGYEETKKKVGRWDAVVARSRTADFVSFPIKHTVNKLQPTEEFLSKFELKSDLERELEEVDPHPIQIEENEEEQVYPMSYDEMIEHRKHIAKIRAQQSYQAAKAKRQGKIKSKKYHRVLKKERLKQQLKEFEELQKVNPEEALKQLDTLEKSRALERHTLRHKNTGKWAKNKMIRAKYDKEVRAQLADQLAVSRALTKKTQDVESTDEDDDEEDNENEVIPDIAISQDPANPWMMKQNNKSNVNAEFDFGYKKFLNNKLAKRKHESDSSDSEVDNENPNNSNQDQVFAKLKHSIRRISQAADKNDVEELDIKDNSEGDNKSKILAKKSTSEDSGQTNINITKNVVKRKQISNTKTKDTKNIKRGKIISTSDWVVESIDDSEKAAPAEELSTAFDSLHTNIRGKVEKKLKKLRKSINELEKSDIKNKISKKVKRKVSKSTVDTLEYLKLNNQRTKAIIDEELIETVKNNNVSKAENNDLSSVINTVKHSAQANTQGAVTANTNIDPNKFIEVKPKYLNTALPGGENDLDLLDDDEQVVPKVNIEDVFEDDDIVASFRQDKDDEISKNKGQDIDLSLPGWGSWGGKGIKARKHKNRFILKAPPLMTRRDENKGDIVIKEYTDPKLSAHKLKDVPFPFKSVKDFEASMRAPLGNTFIPEQAHKKLIKPGVITKAGAIIEPMDEEELLVKKNRQFKNENVIKLLAKQ